MKKRTTTEAASSRTRGPRAKGLRLKANEDGTFTDQYGRLLERYRNEQDEEDLRPVGLDPRGANH